VNVDETRSGDVLKLATGELALVEEIQPLDDGELMQFRLRSLQDPSDSWMTAPMPISARIQGRIPRS
jgi:hypothetical protein